MSLLNRFRATNFNHNATVQFLQLTALCAFFAAGCLSTPGACPMTSSGFMYMYVIMLLCIAAMFVIAVYAVSTRRVLSRMTPRIDSFMNLITGIMLVAALAVSAISSLRQPWLVYAAVGVWVVSAWIVYFNKSNK